MHPCLFRDIWDLSYPQLAQVLPRSEETLKRYGFRKSASKYQEPSTDICILTQMIHDKWIAEGRKPVRPWLIQQDDVAA